MDHTLVELPLFPLNTVLFPGMPISLRIFEERYKQMIATCLENQQPFGIVAIRRGSEVNGPVAEPYPVGCTASIVQVEPLDDGQYNVIAVGRQRFHIRSLDYSLPYLTGTVEFLDQSTANTLTSFEAARRLKPWVARYLKTLAAAQDLGVAVPDLPDEPEALANLAAFVLQVDVKDKQTLLTHNSVDHLLSDLHSLYRREATLLEAVMAHAPKTQLPFSLN